MAGLVIFGGYGPVYVCMYVRMYVCMYVCIYVCIYIRIHVCTYVRIELGKLLFKSNILHITLYFLRK